ncbi:hypothetical protein ANCCAN_22463 [Ancylostoma caninum]|uniref:Asc-type amino acid transporter 1 domain protein n=1 Tax=Ancylostoma caninum TaxID=29170 RepID=A0A368FHP2_ANCCA|nr:hypothetical protein ANCCAN_22463 [Ancylostoma caninum]
MTAPEDEERSSQKEEGRAGKENDVGTTEDQNGDNQTDQLHWKIPAGGTASAMDNQSSGDKSSTKLHAAEDEIDTGRGLKRTLTLTNCITMIIGCIIGSGIFVAPTGIQAAAGSVGASLLIWIFCGIWCGIGAYIYAELGTLITKSGGDYTYIMEAFGPFLGFLRFWIESMVVRPCARCIVGLTFAHYIIRPFYPTCDPPPWSTEILAGLMIVTLSVVNCYSVKLVTVVQDWFTYIKVLALLLVIVTGAWYLIAGGPQYRQSFDNIFESTFRNFYQGSVGFYSGLFAYQGWSYLNFITEELINPERCVTCPN